MTETNMEFWTRETGRVLKLLQGREFAGLPSGFPAIDRNIPGFVRGATTLIGGAPGMGKTALATNIVWRNVLFDNLDERQRILVASVEMGEVLWVERLVSMALGVPQGMLSLKGDKREYWDRDSGKMKPIPSEFNLYPRIEEVLDEFRNWPVVLMGSGLMSTLAIEQQLYHTVKEEGFDVPLVVVDHAGMLADVGESDTSTARPDLICSKFDDIAQTFNTHVLAIWPLTKVGTTTEKVPSYAHLRGSVMPSYQAANILIVHSPLMAELMSARREVVARRIPVNIGIQKNRFFGKYETVEVPFVPAIGVFDDPIPEEWAKRYRDFKSPFITTTEVESG